MKRILFIMAALLVVVIAHADTYSYKFIDTPLSVALAKVADEHQDVNLNFIYNELEDYKTSANVLSSDAYDAIRRIIGLNPVTISRKGKNFYVEAMQHGKYRYTGRVIDTNHEPIVAATLFLLSPNDSTVITYGVTDDLGHFAIPCDRKNVIAKLNYVGYCPIVQPLQAFSGGDIVMKELPVALANVNVTSTIQTQYSDRTVYIPTGRQKQNSNGAIDMLFQMAIPSISVDPVDGRVTTNSRKDVAIFIDSSEATSEELDALKTTDVKKIEYLIYPSDARYKHKPYVINIILQHYEYGGYTKIKGTENIIVGSANALAYSKFSYKRMTYDISAAGNMLDSHHLGSEGKQIFRLASDQEVTRSTTITDSRVKSDRFAGAFRAKYADDNKMISNRLSISYSDMPNSDTGGEIKFSDVTRYADTYRSALSRQVITPQWNGEYYFDFNNDLSLNIEPGVQYNHINSNSFYTANTTDIATIAKENAWFGSFGLQLNKRFDRKHSISFDGEYLHQHDKVTYTGSSPSVQIFKQGVVIGMMTYGLNTTKFYGEFTAGAAAEWNNIDNQKTSDIIPIIYASIQYAFDKTKSLSVSANYATNSTDISTKGGNIVRNNEFLYITGNPRLKNSRRLNADASFEWSPLNQLSISADMGYFEVFERPTPIFIPYANGMAVLRTIENDGNYANEYAGLSFTSRLLNNSLTLSLNPQIWLYQTTGEYEARRAAFLCNFSAMYCIGKFFFSGYYRSGDDMLVQQSMWCDREKTRSTYGFSAGWANKHWNLRASFANPFRHSWHGDRRWLNSKYFTSEQTEISRTYHQFVQLTVSYTIGYGKKIQRNDEVSSGGGSTGSAIMN